jgi:hypothetical protein
MSLQTLGIAWIGSEFLWRGIHIEGCRTQFCEQIKTKPADG